MVLVSCELKDGLEQMGLCLYVGNSIKFSEGQNSMWFFYLSIFATLASLIMAPTMSDEILNKEFTFPLIGTQSIASVLAKAPKWPLWVKPVILFATPISFFMMFDSWGYAIVFIAAVVAEYRWSNLAAFWDVHYFRKTAGWWNTLPGVSKLFTKTGAPKSA